MGGAPGGLAPKPFPDSACFPFLLSVVGEPLSLVGVQDGANQTDTTLALCLYRAGRVLKPPAGAGDDRSLHKKGTRHCPSDQSLTWGAALWMLLRLPQDPPTHHIHPSSPQDRIRH